MKDYIDCPCGYCIPEELYPEANEIRYGVLLKKGMQQTLNLSKHYSDCHIMRSIHNQYVMQCYAKLSNSITKTLSDMPDQIDYFK